MTQKRQLPEQIASHTYWRRKSTEMKGSTEPTEKPRPGIKRSSRNEGSKREPRENPQRERSYTARRVVATPDADPSVAWNTFAQRQEQRRRARARPQRYVNLEPRTYAQTGTWAPGGRSRTMRRPLPPYHNHSSPIPTRSGRRTARRGLLWRLFGVFAGIFIVILSASFAFSSNAFRIEQVNVEGTRNDTLVQSIQKMGVQGENIFLVNVPALTSRIEASPFVYSASLSKQLPNQLTIMVVERVPALLLQTSQGTFVVDRQGVVMASVKEMTGAASLNTVITNDTRIGKGQAAKASQRIQAGARLNPAMIGFALDVFKSLPQATGINAYKLRYDGTMYANGTTEPGTQTGKGTFIVESSDGWMAYLGGADDANPLGNRLIELQQILAIAKEKRLNLATVDLRYGLHPVYTLKS